MNTIKTEGIVLKIFDYRESSQVVHILTPELGKLTIMARGIKRKKSLGYLGLDYFQFGRFTLFKRPGEAQAILQEVEIIETFDYLHTDLLKLCCASIIAEITNLTIGPGEPSRKIFHLYLLYLRDLQNTRFALRLTLLYLLPIISALGFQPQLGKCLNCQQDSRLEFFSPALGGVICSQCAQKTTAQRHSLDQGLRNLMRRALKASPDKLAHLKLTESQRNRLFKIIFSLVRFHITERDLKSLRLMFQLLPELTEFRP